MSRIIDRLRRSPTAHAAFFGSVIAFAVYLFSAAPNVTLLDSGEFIVAAQHFGVPHPTGYPLWTFLGWLFQLLPLGNAAWELAVFSGVCGALATGLAAGLLRHSADWLFPKLSAAAPHLTTALAVTASLLFAFSLSMWSQATIVEVYTLHTLLIGCFLVALYAWIRQPSDDRRIYWVFFTLSLAFANHHLALSLAPLPFIVVLLLRRDLVWDIVVAAALTVLITYLTFALIADQPLVLRAAVRLTWLVGALLIVALAVRRAHLRWKFIALLPVVIAAGLLPYAYLPIASGTNPPMNWGYTQEPDGFFASFNRSQYPGSLSDQSLRVLATVLGLSDLAPATSTKNANPPDSPETTGATPNAPEAWPPFFTRQLLSSFTLFAIPFLLAAAATALRAPPAGRVWLAVLAVGFLLAAFLQPLLDGARTDLAGWWLQMPFHSYTNLLFALLVGTGLLTIAQAWENIASTNRVLAALPWLAVLLPIWPLATNFATASQRDRWHGWEYGQRLVHDLPAGAVLFGGTDPGRFVPTYMIFGESAQGPHLKRDPEFDRRDIYILTQNALADRHYLAYFRDHYASDRPSAESGFQRWLGRETLYPAQPLVLPTLEQIREIIADVTERAQRANPTNPSVIHEVAQGAIAHWIFHRNKDRHRFFVEESFPLRWTYPHAIPRGPIYEIAPDPLPALAPEIVTADFAYWDKLTADLLNDPLYLTDFDAQRAYSRLRLTTGHIYEFRQLFAEAERAFRQSLALWPANPDALRALARLLWERHEFEEPIALFDHATALDPNNEFLHDLRDTAIARRKTQHAIVELEAAYNAATPSVAQLQELIQLHSSVGNQRRLIELISSAYPLLDHDPSFLELALATAEAAGDHTSAVQFATQLAAARPSDPEPLLRLAQAHAALNQTLDAQATLSRAIAIDPLPTREAILANPTLAPLLNPQSRPAKSPP